MCVCYLRGFSSESVYKTNRKRANPRFRIAAIYPSVNIQPLMKTPKIDIQHTTCGVRNPDLTMGQTQASEQVIIEHLYYFFHIFFLTVALL